MGNLQNDEGHFGRIIHGQVLSHPRVAGHNLNSMKAITIKFKKIGNIVHIVPDNEMDCI